MKTIQINDEDYEILNKVHKRLQRSRKLTIEQAIRYLDKLKIDPVLLKEGDPSHAINHLRKDLIAFIKTQEKKKLDPLIDELSIAAQTIKNITLTIPDKKVIEAKFKNLEAKQEQANKTVDALKAMLIKIAEFLNNNMNEKKKTRVKINLLIKDYQEKKSQTSGIFNKKDLDKIEEEFLLQLKSL